MGTICSARQLKGNAWQGWNSGARTAASRFIMTAVASEQLHHSTLPACLRRASTHALTIALPMQPNANIRSSCVINFTARGDGRRRSGKQLTRSPSDWHSFTATSCAASRCLTGFQGCNGKGDGGEGGGWDMQGATTLWQMGRWSKGGSKRKRLGAAESELQVIACTSFSW